MSQRTRFIYVNSAEMLQKFRLLNESCIHFLLLFTRIIKWFSIIIKKRIIKLCIF